jgi:hypothetical protein
MSRWQKVKTESLICFPHGFLVDPLRGQALNVFLSTSSRNIPRMLFFPEKTKTGITTGVVLIIGGFDSVLD